MCCGSWDHKESDTTATELNCVHNTHLFYINDVSGLYYSFLILILYYICQRMITVTWCSGVDSHQLMRTDCVYVDIFTTGHSVMFSQLVQFSHSVVFDSLRPHESQHTRPPCPSPTPGVYSNSCPLNWWCHLTISSSVILFSSCPQSFPTSGSLQLSQHFASGGQNIGVSALASFLPMNTKDWIPLGWTGWISLQSKGPSRVFSNTTVWKH